MNNEVRADYTQTVRGAWGLCNDSVIRRFSKGDHPLGTIAFQAGARMQTHVTDLGQWGAEPDAQSTTEPLRP